MSLADLRSDVVILTCAVSAGIHAALVPSHFGESRGAGAGFLAAAVLLSTLAVASTRDPASEIALAAAAVVFAGLLASYALAITTGLPLLHPDREPVDGLGVFTKVVEAAGLLASSSLLGRPTVALRILDRKEQRHEHDAGRAPDPPRPDRAGRVLQRARRSRRLERA